MKKVIIIGSGISGLSFANYLDKTKYNLEIFEKNHSPGGRVVSEKIDGFTCDIGFQVLLNNYDEVKKLNIYDDLNLKYFNSGAEIYNENGNLKLYNPIHHPFEFIKSNIFSIFTFKDIFNLLLLFLKSKLKKETVGELFKKKFSGKSQNLFLNPFFKGIFLSKNLKNDTIFFHKIFKKFALGKASIPSNGMHVLPKKIIDNLNLKINYNFELKKIENNNVIFNNDKKYQFDILVLALPMHSINKIINTNIKMTYNENKTIYITSTKNVLEKSILLVPNEKFKTNSIQCLSNVSKSYTNNDINLYSLSSLYGDASDRELLEEFKKITGIKDDDLNLIKSYCLKQALPEKIINLKPRKNIYYCGDWNQEPSIDGALKSGRLLAENLNNCL